MTRLRPLILLAVLSIVSGAVARDLELDVWHFQKSMSRDWPAADAAKCADYGSRFDYPECPQAQRTAAKHKMRSSATPRTHADPAPAVPANPESKRRNSLLRVALKVQSPIGRTSCISKMDGCYEACTRDTGMPALCNGICSTGKVCSAPLNLNYGQFLDFQVEMLAMQR